MLQVTIVIDCCAAPTIIIAPSAPFPFYEYVIGTPNLDISLDAQSYTGDNSCCVLAPEAPTVTRMDSAPKDYPAELFTVQPDTITMRVVWSTLDLTSPVGTFKVEYEPVTSECVAKYPSVEYTV